MKLVVLLFIKEDFIMPNNKHLTLNDRFVIQNELREGQSFKFIADLLDKDPSTISKEIKSHFVIKRTGAYGRSFNDCALQQNCHIQNLCHNCSHSKLRYCSFCGSCSKNCSSYMQLSCERLIKPPYVCNGCKNLHRCRLQKSIYDAVEAHKEYTAIKKESRLGINSDEQEIDRIDSIITTGLSSGQSLHHICSCHKDELMISERSLYRYVDMGIFTARNIDMPRKVRYRPRKLKLAFKVDRSCRIGRTFEDYKTFISHNIDLPVVQIDTVEGVKRGKVLMTIHFVKAEFMIAFLRDSNTSKSVTEIFNALYDKLGHDLFKKLFPVILTDNGSEFSNPTAIEFSPSGERRSNVFYCDPSSPHQKGAAENNHEFIRRILPKGSSFNELTQNDIDLMMSHINSYKRKKLNDKTPYESFSFFYNESTAKLLNVDKIDSDKVVHSKSLLR